jgi:ABC-type lipoprotein release transport system permease subunit
VLEFGSKVVARAEARIRAEEEHERAIAAETAHRDELRSQREALAAILIPLTLAGAAAWIFFLTLGNARERRSEVAILRAIGVDESGILSVFLLKAAILGAAGAVVGCLLGLAIGAVWGGVPIWSPEFLGLIRFRMVAAVVILAPVLSGLAAYLPASRAARMDPAVVLMREA